MPSVERRKVLLDVDDGVVGENHAQRSEIPSNERNVSNTAFPANQPLLLRENALEDAPYTNGLLLIALNRAGDLLLMVDLEPDCLAKVGALPGGLEEKPLQLMNFVFWRSRGYFVRGVILLDKVGDDGI